LKVDPDKVIIREINTESTSDWTRVFLKGMSSFRWMSRYIKSQDISELDVKISIDQDLSNRTKNEQFKIAYYENMPIGIIRAAEYWGSNSFIIPSHFPLVIPRFQRKGVGKILVRKIIEEAFNKDYKEIWAETWSKDKRELSTYQSFFEKIGFRIKSNRSEMSCSLEKYDFKNNQKISSLETIIDEKITDSIVKAISKSYSKSKDKLHRIEQLGKFNECKIFLNKIKTIFEQLGYKIECYTAEISNELCAGLITATSRNKGMVLEIGVLPKFRKQGIGKELVLDYMKHLKEDGINEVTLAVDKDNIPAIKLYQKLGFKHNWHGMIFLLENEQKLNVIE
jgi:ribosomal protein S18 acetylase RimI-like enzyme